MSNEGEKGELRAPLETAGFFSRIVFGWVSPLVTLANKRPIDAADVFELPSGMKTHAVLERFDKYWDEEVKAKGKEKASMGWVFFRTYKWLIIRSMIIYMFAFAFFVIGPVVFLRNLVKFARDEDASIGVGLAFAFCLLLSEILRSVFMQQYWFQCVYYSLRYTVTFYGLVYRKALELRDLGGYSVGELVNVSANDSQRIFEAGVFSQFIILSVVNLVVVMVVGWIYLGPACLIGVLVFLFSLPVQFYFSKKSGSLRRKAIEVTDQRVRMMNEILTCIKLIKMYAWEIPFAAKIKEIREREKVILRKAGYLQSVTVSLVPILPAIASVSTFLVQAYYGNGMTADDVFTVLAMFNVLRIALEVLPRGVKSRAEAKIGLHRLKNFLLLEDVRQRLLEPDDEDVHVELKNATVVWPTTKNLKESEEIKLKEKKNESSATKEATFTSFSLDEGKKSRIDTEDTVVLNNVNLIVKRGELVGICGGVGVGKSTLLATLFGQAKVREGHAKLRGRISYVSQQAWIQSDTLINNILFGAKLDRDVYDRVVECCSLRRDLEVLPAGENTEIGERGINVSGGQKQRISLARAVYANHDIYLLDDPLSAVDAHVGKSIFEDCIQGQLKEKTVLLVTHQLQYLPRCDRVCFIHDGHAIVGTHAQLLQTCPDYKELIAHHHDDNDEASEDIEKVISEELERIRSQADEDEDEEKEIAHDGKLTEKESMQKGQVVFQSYVGYAKAGGGILIFSLLLLLFAIAMFGRSFSDFYLALWIGKGDGNSTAPASQQPGDPSNNPMLDTYATVFGLITVGIIVFQILKGFLFSFLSLRSSTNLHSQLFHKISHAPMSFFDTTPTGRILNRFSRDMDEVDVRLPFDLEKFTQNVFLIISLLALIAYVFPYFIIALVIIFFFYVMLVRYFRPLQRQLARVSNTTHSPVVSQLSATLQGSQIISAFGKQEEMKKLYFKKVNDFSKCFYAYTYSSAWFAFRLDFTTAFIIFAVGLLSVLLHGKVSPELIAATISFSLAFSGFFQYTTRLSAEVESRFTSVERILNYIDTTPMEKDCEKQPPQSLPLNWPSRGEVTFKAVEVCYRPGLPSVLKNVSFHIRTNEKIGIVGRTGAGKSTITMVLFRMLELTKGSILIDDVDITSMSPSFLRSKLSIIPQDPVLFVGTIRYNVDPFDEYSDEAVWQALEQAHVKPLVSTLEKGLQAEVIENGENFSVGERQLFCMARALLRKSKVLVMDEATAAIDTKTDYLIQETIRTAFVDCTVLTIAHRLNTIMDSDRILVMGGGQVLEFDHPTILSQDRSSYFSKMLDSSNVGVDRSMPFDETDFRKQLEKEWQHRGSHNFTAKDTLNANEDSYVSVSIV
eukprot:m.95054 g.95054  ORF g.95054 m.95054 type:complete len:1356 (-) comp8936_c0_seq4:1185-5252(-)